MDRNQIDFVQSPIRLIDGWMERASNEEDVLFKFVAYWLAFTQMYNYGIDEDEISEIGRIKRFCRGNNETIFNIVDFEADYMKIFKERPILRWTDTSDRYDWREGPDFIAERIMTKFSRYREQESFERNCREAAKYYVNICNPRYSKRERAEALIMSIYRVRCNLFHAKKDPETRRNFELINSSAVILEKCLNALKAERFCW